MLSGALHVLNLAVLFAAIFFFASTLASHALEAFVGFINSRGKQLRRRLEVALGAGVARELYESPLLRSLSSDGTGRSTRHAPSYIEPAYFARAVAALAKDPGSETARQELIRELKEEADRGGSPFEARLAEWYQALTDRQSGVYTRWSTLRLFAFGFLLAAALDIDVVHLGATLWSRPEVAERLVARLEQTAPGLAPGDPSALPEAERDRLVEALAAAWPELRAEAAAPYAWRKDPRELTGREWAGKLLGWVLTALATSLGAQFWFRLLSESLKLRAAGRKPAATRPPPAGA